MKTLQKYILLATILIVLTQISPITLSQKQHDSHMNTNETLMSSYQQIYPTVTPETSCLPQSFSWKNFGNQDWTTPAKNQTLKCGCCWIFAAVGIIESKINIKEGNADINPDLSEQYVLSCLPDAGNGCNGGYPYNALKYILDSSHAGNNHNGIIPETCFPYQINDTIPCDEKCDEWLETIVPIKDYDYLIVDESPRGIQKIKHHLMQEGPLAACMLVTKEWITWGYHHHDPTEYWTTLFELGEDHDIILVGWKDDPSLRYGGYWICKNSLGLEWGYDGFFNLEYQRLGSRWIDNDPRTTYITWVDYNPQNTTWPNERETPYAPQISGPSSGLIGKSYTYTLSATDPQQHDISFFISWGDGTTEEWIGPYPSDFEITLNHTWHYKGTYPLMVIVKNTQNALSPWATYEITMPINTPQSRLLPNHLGSIIRFLHHLF
ncbi:MAG: C1 family peptidase [Candidatus Thermoplasmatota archaeon]|nr:C1 family peptidase [Candidatus Thermoplasmatota archaeon]MBU1940962.1 C1 family peptidase [Candidatus Thermoplasmatota archaeon]